MFIISKTKQLTRNIVKSTTQSSFEKSSNFRILMGYMSEIQTIKDKISQPNFSADEKKELNLKLSNRLIESLILKHKITLQPKEKIETPIIPSLAQVQSKLKEKQGIIEYCVNDTLMMYAFITRDTTIHFIKRIANVKEIISNELRAVKTGGDSDALSEILFSDIENEILKLSHLTIIPDNLLNSIPFEWLKIPSSGKRLINYVTTNYSYSTVLWYYQKEQQKPKQENKLLLVAPVFPPKNNEPILASSA